MIKSKSPIRILYCIETIASGGVEQTRLTLVRGLPKSDFQIKIICTYASGPIMEDLEKEGIELIVVGSMRGPFHWKTHKQVMGVIRAFRPDIIHGGVFEGNSMAALSGFLMKVPVIILEETSDPQNRSPKANWLLRQYVKLVHKIIAISPEVENYLISKAKIPNTKIKLVNNGVAIPIYPSPEQISNKKTELGIKDGDLVVGFVGRFFNDHKRLTDLLVAVSLINDSRIKALVVGDGRDRNLLYNKVKSLNLQEQVIMVGYQNETSLYYSMMDIFTVPSAREGFGLVAAEAMLHRLPVIATNVGGLKSVVLDGETGFLVPPYSPQELAEKIKILIQNPEFRIAMGEIGYRRALVNYTAERYCKELKNLYLNLLSKNEKSLN